jgi:hypothetical protein
MRKPVNVAWSWAERLLIAGAIAFISAAIVIHNLPPR